MDIITEEREYLECNNLIKALLTKLEEKEREVERLKDEMDAMRSAFFKNFSIDTAKFIEMEKEIEQSKLELPLLTEKHLLQIKNRLPIEIADKVDSWSRCLTAVSQLKQERNNCDIELAELKALGKQ